MNESDRELLKLAARASGITVTFHPDGLCRNCTGLHAMSNVYTAPYWNPLTDDGDALRLAVKLGLEAGFRQSYRGVWVSQPWKNVQATEDVAIDYGIEQATRRAIVRAAAEIGKAMP